MVSQDGLWTVIPRKRLEVAHMKYYRNRIAFKSISGIVALLFIFAAIVCVFGFNDVTAAILDQYSDGAFQTAEIASSLVDAERMEAYAASGGEGEDYATVSRRLQRLCDLSGSTFVYVIEPDLTDYGHIRFIFSTMNSNSSYQHYEFGYVRETTNNDYRTKYRNLYEGKSDQELVFRDRGYIETDPHITAMVALRDADGQTRGIVCVQKQMDIVVRQRRLFVRRVFFLLLLSILIVTTGQAVYLTRVLLDPLKMISREASRFAAENVKAEHKLTESIRNKDEIGDLAASIDRMEEQIQNYIDSITKITAERERIRTELSLATRIQADMLPSEFPAFPEYDSFDIFASMHPAKEVGGDFYDFFLVDRDHLCLVIADVSGKGIPAALFMMASRIILANNVMSGKSLPDVLASTNAAICANNKEEMFVTVWLGILDISTGRITAANAGHEYPAIRKGDRDFELYKDRHGFVVGGMEGVKYKEYEITLNPGDKLFLYTDGLPEATDPEEHLFGTDRMLEALNETKDAAPKEILKHMKDAAYAFADGAPMFDDMTMLCLEYNGVGPS